MRIKYIFILIILFACNSSKTDKKNIKLFYLSKNQFSDDVDTIPYLSKYKNTYDDTLIYQDAFQYCGKIHVINMTTNEFKTGVDGGIIRYKLDDLGSIYSRSKTWKKYIRLKSNNDSLNNLIDRALEIILLNKKFTCVNLDTFKIKNNSISF